MVGVPSSDLEYVDSSRNNSLDWVYNEVKPSDGAIGVQRVDQHPRYEVVVFYGVGNPIKVSTLIDWTLIGADFPPSQGAFRDDVRVYIDPIIAFLAVNNVPLLVNAYPYFSMFFLSRLSCLDPKRRESKRYGLKRCEPKRCASG
ncbi:putative licheninase [Helianthus annuus]|nr:putative licheninase [Helianthus annuus]KAJ0571981.1 putative licheninase [Helianthus annuus]KAJ0910061.1 putative licheninase [Helianthus annuus]